ncbi:MAG TPA: biopolymer transporter ExbD [Burkholderiaceae bacterium]|nr:biopolymer transporter ExbD [Burkholderiaceae bacterium]
MAFGGFENKGGGQTMSEINMVPLIDVMLVLLVIFIITAPLLTHSIKVDVPRVSAQPTAAEPDAVDLAIDAKGRMFWNDEPVDMSQLGQRLDTMATQNPQPRLRLRADLNTRYEVLARIMGLARAAGVTRLGFVTQPSGASP